MVFASCHRHSQSSPCWQRQASKNFLREVVPRACKQVPLKLAVPADIKSDPFVRTTGNRSALASLSYKTVPEAARDYLTMPGLS